MKARTMALLALFLFCIAQVGRSQEDVSKAAALAAGGKFQEAINAYTSILSADQHNTAALLGRGFVYSWKHDFTAATRDFNQVLAAEPGNREAKKGLAYVDLWSRHYKKAIRSFSALLETEKKPEYFIALGQAQMNDGQLKNARASFAQAVQMDPANKEPAQLITATKTRSALIDLDIIGGVSSAGSGSKTGLRLIQVQSQVTPAVQLGARYDNSLSIDNLGLILRNRAVPYYAGSVLFNWSGKALTRVEAGARNYEGATKNELGRETQFSAEQVFFLGNNRAVKAGMAVITPDVGSTAFLFFTGYRHPVSEKITAGLQYFHANRNTNRSRENRLVADADLRLPGGGVINAGGYYGHSASDDKTLVGNTYGGFIRGYFPVSPWLGFHAGIASENNFMQTLFNANAGIRIRIEK